MTIFSAGQGTGGHSGQGKSKEMWLVLGTASGLENACSCVKDWNGSRGG